MGKGWAGITSTYNAINDELTNEIKKHPLKSYEAQRRYIDHNHGMLQLIPLLKANPVLENYQPEPYTSLLMLVFHAKNLQNQIEIIFNISPPTYKIRLLHNLQHITEADVDRDDVANTVLHLLPQLD